MKWPCQDATVSGKESEEVDDDEQLSVHEAGDFIGRNEPLSVPGFGEAIADCENSSRNTGSVIPVPSFVKQAETLEAMMQNAERHFPDLVFTMVTTDEQPLLQISQRQLYNHPPFGMVSCVQISCRYNTYIAYVLMREWEIGSLGNNEDLNILCLKFCDSSEYKFCPGLNAENYEREYYASIQFHIKSVRRIEFPFARVDSVNCLLWFKLAANATAVEMSSKEVKCRHCKRLVLDLECQKGEPLQKVL